jgi:hypothetical protein
MVPAPQDAGKLAANNESREHTTHPHAKIRVIMETRQTIAGVLILYALTLLLLSLVLPTRHSPSSPVHAAAVE